MSPRVEFLGTAGAMPIPRPLCGCPVCEQARVRSVPYGRNHPRVFVHGPDALIIVTIPVRSWLERLAEQVETVASSPAIASTPAIASAAVALPSSFPGDPADRLIYATAIERGWRLVTKDRRLRDYRHPRPVTLW